MTNNSKIDYLRKSLRVISDFPNPGISFRDVTSLFSNSKAVSIIRDCLVDEYRFKDVDKVVCVESRGFVAGSILADRIHAGIVLARKHGKLPGEVVSETYIKEYGEDSIEISEGAIKEGDVVVIHDDLLATGGTAIAVYNLVKRFKPSKIYFSFLIEINDEGCHGRELLHELGDGISVIL